MERIAWESRGKVIENKKSTERNKRMGKHGIGQDGKA